MKRLITTLLWTMAVMGGTAQTAWQTLVEELSLSDGATDMSNAEEITMAEPQMAYVNLTGFNSMPTSKSQTKKGWLEMYDGQGIYLRKPVTVSAQGNYTLAFPKKNFVCHFCNEAWNEDEGSKFTIGDWVEQDAFHFKAFYTDYIRGIGEVGYKLFDDVVADRAPYWERFGYYKESRARCYPDAFPCAVYLNGQFYGVFAWQLRKHRKNMNQKKSDAKHIHLDGNLSDDYLFRGTITWKRFEVRNPKGLYNKNGALYDGDNPTELMGTDSPYYNNANDNADVAEAKQMTAEVKQHIVDMSHYWSQLKQTENQGATPQMMRYAVEERYDTEGLVDYYVFYHFTQNGDGSLKNWQWFTYDGQRWTVTPYDLDQTFGLGLYGNLRPYYFPIEDLTSGPFYWISKYYRDDACDRYALMRQTGVFTYDNIVDIIDNWYERVGQQFYDMEKERWPVSPCYCDAICNEGWEWCDDWSLYEQSSGYNENTQYHAGDVCILEGKLWRATTDIKGVKPFIRNANMDSIERIHEWVAGRIEFMDAYFCYEPQENATTAISYNENSRRRLVGVYSLQGTRLQNPVAGQVNVFRYSDGTSKKILVR